MIAVSYQQWAICDWLIKQKINVKHKSSDQQTILHVLADQRGNLNSDASPQFIKVINSKMISLYRGVGTRNQERR